MPWGWGLSRGILWYYREVEQSDGFLLTNLAMIGQGVEMKYVSYQSLRGIIVEQKLCTCKAAICKELERFFILVQIYIDGVFHSSCTTKT